MRSKIDELGVDWADSGHGRKSLYIAHADISAVMFEGFKEG